MSFHPQPLFPTLFLLLLFPLFSSCLFHSLSLTCSPIPCVFQSTGLLILNQIWNGKKQVQYSFLLTQECNYHQHVKFKCTNSEVYIVLRLPWWLSGKEFTCQCRRCGLDPWVGKVPWRRKWQPTPVFLPGKPHGLRSLVGGSPWGREESGTTKRLHFHALEKEMATHSRVLAWRIPGTGMT